MPSCYDNIIGLAREDCPCLPTDPPDDFNTSESGLYMTDLPPFESLEGFDECGTGSVWDLLERSREEAINTFIADTNSLLMRSFSPRRERFIGQIGEATSREVLSTDKTYAGVRISCNPMRGGTIKITKIGTLFSGAGTLSLSIYNSLNVQVWAGTVNITNGFNLNTLSTPITLPTFIDYAKYHEYFLVYTFNGSNPARVNQVGACGSCNFMPWYDNNAPMWQKGYSGPRAWANWVMCGSWSGDDLTSFDDCGYSTDTRMNGITLQVELGCDISQVLCNGALDYNADPFALTMAFAIRYKASEIMATRLLGATEINRYNMINREYLQAMKREWNSKYAESVQYLAQEAQLKSIDCLTCRDDSNMRVQTILS